MPRESYQERLDALRDDVLYMSELAAGQVRDALDALARTDAELARQVIDGDEELNQLYLELESDCVDLLALQQPVAGDLRFIASSFKIITDLERIGDLATNLAEYAMDAEETVFPDVDVQRIGELALDHLDQATTAYATEDTELCHDVAAADDEVDRLCTEASESIVRELVSQSDDDRDADVLLSEVSRLFLTIRDLERVGDHAVNIAARALYMVENDDALLY
ncbi:phosphate signaling complex protein PhoU [Halobaculum sp. MBLA0147]|uniref:phosphate signaling complex protein PhoU n=1 Tax=Halobaculum sp. MBLA0147 TaxID=3079934 RepID=UPI003524378D